MIPVSCKVDQRLRIGESLVLTLTDTAPTGVRMLVEGLLIGGSDDGLKVREFRELSPDRELRLGSLVTIRLLEATSESARLGVVIPQHVQIALSS